MKKNYCLIRVVTIDWINERGTNYKDDDVIKVLPELECLDWNRDQRGHWCSEPFAFVARKRPRGRAWCPTWSWRPAFATLSSRNHCGHSTTRECCSTCYGRKRPRRPRFPWLAAKPKRSPCRSRVDPWLRLRPRHSWTMALTRQQPVRADFPELTWSGPRLGNLCNT